MSDFWRIMDSCVCGYIDHSPCVNPPYCMIKGEDYDCDQCVVTEEEKDKAIGIFENNQDLMEKEKQERIAKEKEMHKQIKKQIRLHNSEVKRNSAERKQKSDEFERKCFADAFGKELEELIFNEIKGKEVEE